MAGWLPVSVVPLSGGLTFCLTTTRSRLSFRLIATLTHTLSERKRPPAAAALPTRPLLTSRYSKCIVPYEEHEGLFHVRWR
jgi:hypothetical protein